MLKVRFETITLRVPVIDNSGEHDAKMDQQTFNAMQRSLAILQGAIPQGANWLIQDGLVGQDLGANGASTRLVVGGAAASPTERNGWRPGEWVFAEKGRLPQADLNTVFASPSPPVSQVDPPINTAVSDREMRSDAPDMSLEEFRERPERTRAPPRPRANSWRHGNG